VFVELVPLLKDRTVLITVASIDGKLKVNLIPTKGKEGEQEALTTPLSFTGYAEELDAELGNHLASYVHSHVELRNTLEEAKAEMDAAAKAARQKVKTTPPAPKSDPPKNHGESAHPARTEPDITPSLFAGQAQTVEPASEAKAEGGGGTTTP
jgi:PRTRC genetic system protein E